MELESVHHVSFMMMIIILSTIINVRFHSVSQKIVTVIAFTMNIFKSIKMEKQSILMLLLSVNNVHHQNCVFLEINVPIMKVIM